MDLTHVDMTLLDNFEELMDQSHFYFPEFMDTTDKYNKTVRETNSGEKFEQLVNKFADDSKITPSRMESLCEMMVRDLILVHNDESFTHVLNVVHSVINMMKFYHSHHQ